MVRQLGRASRCMAQNKVTWIWQGQLVTVELMRAMQSIRLAVSEQNGVLHYILYSFRTYSSMIGFLFPQAFYDIIINIIIITINMVVIIIIIIIFIIVDISININHFDLHVARSPWLAGLPQHNILLAGMLGRTADAAVRADVACLLRRTAPVAPSRKELFSAALLASWHTKMAA
jgi:hypothetical protein